MDVPRGPFKCSRDWMLSELLMYEKDAHMRLQRQDESKDDECDGPRLWKMASRLRSLLYDVFPTEHDFLEEFVLQHGDITFQNLLADDDGNITGMID